MKYIRKKTYKHKFINKKHYKSKRKLTRKSRRKIKHTFKSKSRRRLKYYGGSNGLIQLGYNTTRGITSTIKNFINTYIGDFPSVSPQATNSQYQFSK